MRHLRAPAVFAGFLAFYMTLFGDVVWGGMSFTRRDIFRFYYPLWHQGVEAMRHGRVPLWDALNGFGAPFLANVQTGVFYPLQGLLYLGDFTWCFNFFILFHLALAGFFTYLWMRDLGASGAGAVLAGAAFGMGGVMMSQINLTISLCSAAYLPLVLLCFRRSLAAPAARRWRLATGAALALQYLAGDPAVLAGTGAALFFMAAAGRLRGLWTLAQGAAVFLLLTAFQWVPFVELVLASDRAVRPAQAMQWSMPWTDLAGFAIPFFSDIGMYTIDYFRRQSWLENYYAGVIVLVLAAAGFHRGRSGRWMAGLAALGVVLAAGRHLPPVAWLFGNLPPLSFIRFPVRFIFLTGFALACLAGLGLDAMVERKPASPRGARFAALALAAMVLLLWAYSAYLPRAAGDLYAWFDAGMRDGPRPFYFQPERFRGSVEALLLNVKRSWIFAVWAGALILAAPRLGRRATTSLLILLAVADLSLANVAEPRERAENLERPSENLLSVMGKGLGRVAASPGMMRSDAVCPLEGFKNRFVSNTPSQFGVHDALGYNSLFIRQTDVIRKAYLALPSIPEGRFLDWLNIEFVASPHRNLGGAFRPHHASERDLAYVSRNRNVLPRAFLVRRAERVADLNDTMRLLMRDDHDPTEILYVDGPLETAPDVSQPGEGAVRITRYDPEEVRMEVRVEGRPWLFFSDAYYPGWRLSVDGRPQRIYRANGAFRACRLSKGEHRLVWRYDPLSFKAGAAVSLLALAVFGGVAGVYFCTNLHIKAKML